MLVHLIRHADYDSIDDALNGRRPGLGLNAAGRVQAERLAACLPPVSAVVSSPLERATQTAAALGQAETDSAFVEIDFGAWTGRTVSSLDGDPAWRLWNERRGMAGTPGGETMAAVQARAAEGLARLCARMPDAAVAVVSHADVIRGVLCSVLGLSLDLLLRFEIAPASRSTIRFEPWGATLVTLNRTLD